MKRFISTFIVILMVFCLCACSNNSATVETAIDAKTESESEFVTTPETQAEELTKVEENESGLENTSDDVSEESSAPAGMSIGSIVTFGTFEQDGDESNGQETIEWIVLDNNSGQTLLISKDILTAKCYFNADSSDVLNWLNSDFYESAFSDQEKQQIASEDADKVFLLSEDLYYNYEEISGVKDCAAAKCVLESDITIQTVSVNGKNEFMQTGWWVENEDNANELLYVLVNFDPDGHSYDSPGGTIKTTENKDLVLGVRPVLLVLSNNLQ